MTEKGNLLRGANCIMIRELVAKMYQVLNELSALLRWRDWGPGKIPVFCTLLGYIALAERNFSVAFVTDFALFIIFASIHSGLGYVVNDWGDREIDKLHQKPNAFQNLNYFHGILFLAVLSVIALLSGLPFVRRPMVLPLWITWAFFTLTYSLRPLRLKERGVWGLGVSSVAQWTVPVLLTFAAMRRFGSWDMIVFVIANSISGATLEIAHQRYDQARDLSTRTNTFGTRLSSAKLDRLYSAALFSDKMAIGAVLVSISVGIAQLGPPASWIGLVYPLIAIYLILLLIAYLEIIRSSMRGEFLDPYYSLKRSANKILHETMPNLIVPSFLLLLLTLLQPVNGILLLTFLYWRLALGKAEWKWPLRVLHAWFSK
jgi:4-hydroxybenzoate polyprenyltransferase